MIFTRSGVTGDVAIFESATLSDAIEAEQHVLVRDCCREHTGGSNDHVFAACSILGYAFVPRIRDLPSKRLYVFDRAGVPKLLRPLVRRSATDRWGQWRLRQELYQTRRWPQWSHCWSVTR